MQKLKITVERIDGYCNQPMLVGDCFYVEGGKIMIPEGKTICLWALQSMMPIIPLMQRSSSIADKNDWTSRAGQFVCPDPKGLVHYRLEQTDE